MAVTLKFTGNSGATTNINAQYSSTLQCAINNAQIPAGYSILSSHVLWKMDTEFMVPDAWYGSPPSSDAWGKWLGTLTGSLSLSTDGSNFTTILANNKIHGATAECWSAVYDYPNTHGGGYYYAHGTPAHTLIGFLVPMCATDSETLRALLSSNFSTYYVRATIGAGLSSLDFASGYDYVAVRYPRAELCVVIE